MYEKWYLDLKLERSGKRVITVMPSKRSDHSVIVRAFLQLEFARSFWQ